MNNFLKWKNALLCMLLFLTVTACSSNKGETKKTSPTQNVQSTDNETSKLPLKLANSTSSFSKQIATAASSGHVLGVDFAAHLNTILEVQKKWGKSDNVSKVGITNYAEYKKKNITFGYISGQPISDIRSYSPELKTLTISTIIKEIGNPSAKRTTNSENIYVYILNNNFQLKFIISKRTGKVDHISVFSPYDSVSKIPNSPYIISIKGVSNQLSPKAWANMQQWRKDIALFTRKNLPNMFLNGPNKKLIALTFDDGPDNINTLNIIDTLYKYKVKGNFFFLGSKAKMYPEVVKKAYANGNLILSHSYYHNDLSKETTSQITSDLKMTEKTINQIIGRRPAILRPPFGETNAKVISTAKSNGYKIVLWSIDTLDWSQKESANIQKNVLNNVRNGDIILMHSNEDKVETAKALPKIISELKRRGFKIVDLETLLKINAYK